MIGTIGVVALVVFLAIIFGMRRSATLGTAPSLEVWGVAEGTSAFRELVEGYGGVSGAAMEYREFPPEIYESQLLNALAAGEGPDVFMIHSHALSRDIAKLTPADPTRIDVGQFQQFFPAVAEQDFVRDGQIYAMPLYIDTLALFYNKDLLDQGGVAEIPRTWEAVQAAVSRIKQIDSRGQIVRAGISLGGSTRSIFYGPDILVALMIQNGTAMIVENGGIADFFGGSYGDFGYTSNSPGMDAFNFYLQFANAGSPYYTWNDSQEEALDSFAGGRTAMTFGYHRDIKKIRERSPFLNFGVADFPQPAASNAAVNYANYWGFAVSRQSSWGAAGWDFVRYATTDSNALFNYLSMSGHPPALRSLIGANTNDLEMGVFARQALTARSWAVPDEEKVRQILSNAIENAITGRLTPDFALSQAQEQVNYLLDLP